MGNEHFFDFAAEVGLTKHLGGVRATEELIELCNIGQGKYVLDVGCGAGVTPCFIAKKCGCRVVGVDILEGMVEKSRERAKKEGLSDRVEFRKLLKIQFSLDRRGHGLTRQNPRLASDRTVKSGRTGSDRS